MIIIRRRRRTPESELVGGERQFPHTQNVVYQPESVPVTIGTLDDQLAVTIANANVKQEQPELTQEFVL